MTSLIIKKLSLSSFAKVFALYSLYVSVLISIIDLFTKIFSGASSLTLATSWGAWVLYILGFIILSPILGYIMALLMGFLINLSLKVADGLDIEVQ